MLIILDKIYTESATDSKSNNTHLLLRNGLSDINLDLFLPPPDLTFRVGVGHGVTLELHAGWPSLAVEQLHVILEQKEAESNLDLVTGEEATRTGVLAVTERHVLRAGGDKLPVILFACLVAKLEESVYLELFWLWVQFWVDI